MRYRDVEWLVRRALGTEEQPWDGQVVPGPFDPDDNPGEYVIVTGYGGPGEDAEGTLDLMTFQVRVVGPQKDYDAAEDQAIAIDKSFLSWYSARVGTGPWLAGIQRVGGAPNPLLVDNAERWHFVCSYIFRTELALAN